MVAIANHQVLPSATLKEIRSCVGDLLTKCNIQYTVTSFDSAFVDACIQDAQRRGCPLAPIETQPEVLKRSSCAASSWESGPEWALDAHQLPSIRPKVIEGACIAATAYKHVTDERIKVYIALYTAVLIYLEDYMQDDASIQLIAEFTTRFAKRQPQVHPVLSAFADILRDAHDLFAPVAANLIVTSGLSFVTAVWLEHGMDKLQLNPDSLTVPEYARRLSGSAEAYAVFIFAQDTSPADYVQALPDIVTVINYTKYVTRY
ncbi:hypothetical protein HGRIS_010718 [Hohenbuehelia grisea]|uniref:Uncharacterized protein n=1 Tax=Hohenbuehelia grisea TaxID=104357 RepID=A0ABR3IY25_9AGAR